MSTIVRLTRIRITGKKNDDVDLSAFRGERPARNIQVNLVSRNFGRLNARKMFHVNRSEI